MSRSTFDTLADVWHQLAAKPIEADIGPSPWAGDQLIAKSRGIYYVGIASDAEAVDGEQSFEAVASGNEYGILYKAVAEESRWDKQPRESRTYWFRDRIVGNTYVHCYHPKYMSTQGFFEAAVIDIVRLARETLPSF
jgi:hypothetical protein